MSRKSPVAVADRTEGLERRDGFLPLYWDEPAGALLFELSAERLGREFLYHWGLTTGVGSVHVGLDRGSVGGSALARFRRSGDRVLVEIDNLTFRAHSDNPELVRSVRESFSPAVVAALAIEAEDRQSGIVLVDAAPLLIRDATGVAAAVKRASLGEVRLDERRSGAYEPSCRSFPRNTELEALLTFGGEGLDSKLARVLADGRTLTVRVHHSLMALPDDGFRPRALDPRVGFIARSHHDFAAAWDEPLEKQWIVRWRLQKQDPSADISPPVQPLVYYLDRAIPEPIREAMREGALWWNEAFEAAGFSNAMEVRDLPDGVDPLDARYSVIQWVHRADRGWSVGAVWSDPRTGEILCARPRMDSHRVRTVHNYWRAAVPMAHEAGDLPACCAAADPAGDLALTLGSLEDSEAVMLRRIALLTCHEVGHTLGLPHNFGASRYDRGSVMEYFTPRIEVRDDGTLDLSDAYMHGVGSWDVHAIRWAYSQFPDAEEADWLAAIARDGLERGVDFVPTSDPRFNPYDDGTDAVAHLRDAMTTRRALLATFGPEHLRDGEPVADLDARLGLVYLFHRYGIDAAVKLVGGMEHAYALSGDGQEPTRIVPAIVQSEALDLLLDALDPAELAIPERILRALPPQPFAQRQSFDASTARAGYAFDQIAAARTVAAMVLDALLEPERCARLVAFAARDENAPALDEVLHRVVERVWRPDHREAGDAGSAALGRAVQRALCDRLMALAADDTSSPEVRAEALYVLGRVRQIAERRGETSAFEAAIAADVVRFLDDPSSSLRPTGAPQPPPGPPV